MVLLEAGVCWVRGFERRDSQKDETRTSSLHPTEARVRLCLRDAQDPRETPQPSTWTPVSNKATRAAVSMMARHEIRRRL